MKNLFIFLFIFLTPLFCYAEDNSRDEFFSARVIKILEQKTTILPDGKKVEQQKLQLNILDEENTSTGSVQDKKTIIINEIGNFDVLKKNIYKEGDKVLILRDYNQAKKEAYFITDYERSNSLLFLFILFAIVVIAVGRLKGLRSLISLVLSFFVLTGFLIPKILSGADPVVITLISSFFIILIVIYITEGFNKSANIVVLSLFIGLGFSIFLSYFFVELTQLSGFASEDVFYLVDIGAATINFKGLLLAGIIIGTLGVLDDVVVSQVKAVEQLIKANPKQTKKEIFNKAYTIGVSHIGSMINTLFLAYTGASLPLLVLFISGTSAFSSWGQIINNEQIATEIVRTLSGSIGLVLCVPIATIIAVHFLKRDNK